MFDNIDKDINETFEFVNKQREHLQHAVDESNNLKEYQCVLRNSLKMIHGQEAELFREAA